MMKKNKLNKEEIAEDYCFTCKDGGHLRVCDFKNCLKAYHPQCVGKDPSFMESDERWTCGWHSCFICQKASALQCYCCPNSVCYSCIKEAEFVQVKKRTKGFCNNCLKLAILIEENIDVDSDGGKVDFRDTETYEFLFKDYWEIIKDQEGLTLIDLQAANALLKRGENYKGGSDSDKLEEEDVESEGVKKALQTYKVGTMSTDVVLRVSNYHADVQLFFLSDDDFDEDECEDLLQLANKGLFKRPTVAELEKKIRSVHADIMNHWIDKEVLKLQKLIDRANEKGWRRELFAYIDEREKLRTSEERKRLLQEIPTVVADISQTKVKTTNGPPISSECQLPKAADVNNSGSGHVIEIEEDHGVQDSKITVNMRISDHVDDEDKTWHYVDPSGNEQGPFDMVSLRYWMREGFFDEDFKVWKTGQSREDAILLTDALRLYQ
uniref:GYF domain-containing protein n=1 Tax=Musa acuminata subsp. malaccensis TaxID=214687 RepID=A0A804IF55_MUSAM